jgi:hypothetical protein
LLPSTAPSAVVATTRGQVPRASLGTS